MIALTELTSLRNIGKEREKKLRAVDIPTAEALKKIGSKEAFIRLKLRDPYVCLVHLYALEGAVSDREYNQLPEEVKRDLKAYSDSFK
ncbi:MAG: TfoX/Sxy family protein [Oscillospiraceae bacterium]|nr:TfoX/Sxy family protein [Oscillospiraceae bacterium]